MTDSIDNKLQKKIDFAISLIRSASQSLNGDPIEVAYSGETDCKQFLEQYFNIKLLSDDWQIDEKQESDLIAFRNNLEKQFGKH